jgi:hypothetical protein
MLKSSVPVSSNIFSCEKCNYNSSRLSQFNRHILTSKHKKNENSTICQQISTNINIKSSEFICSCGKVYKERSGLWRHKKICNSGLQQDTILKEKVISDKEVSDKEVILMLIKENIEFKNMLMEQQNMMLKIFENGTNNHINNSNVHSNNKTFNLQFFLNETCKDAINLVDFVESLEVQLTDLEETARLGYSEGVSRIFINGLNELDVCKRPIHCSDAKRETLYIKDQNVWEKEDTNKTKISKAIKAVSNKNIQQIFEWQKKYPDFSNPDSKQSDKYMEMICNTMSGSSKEEQEHNLNKIIKNVTKEVVIDKNI